MKHRNAPGIVPFLLVPLLGSGCATAALWKATNPDRPNAVAASTVDDEALRARGYRPDPPTTQCTEKRTRAQRATDHGLRFLLTPATVTIDVASVVGLLWIGSFADNTYVFQSGGKDHIQPRETATPPSR
jgi:hypothetical protein